MGLLRYPGGKSRGHLRDEILDHLVPRLGTHYGEPFLGGGGILLTLLERGLVTSAVVAEKDAALRSLWVAVRDYPEHIGRQVVGFSPTVEAFLDAKSRVIAGSGSGFDALVVNRLSHAGRGAKAGPQGGLTQTGKYKIDCRWNTGAIVREITRISALLQRVSILSDYLDCEADCYYFDPPYWEVGNELYLHGFTPEDHARLADHIDRLKVPWVLSYNNHPEAASRYAFHDQYVTGASGNGGDKPKTELIIVSPI